MEKVRNNHYILNESAATKPIITETIAFFYDLECLNVSKHVVRDIFFDLITIHFKAPLHFSESVSNNSNSSTSS